MRSFAANPVATIITTLTAAVEIAMDLPLPFIVIMVLTGMAGAKSRQRPVTGRRGSAASKLSICHLAPDDEGASPHGAARGNPSRHVSRPVPSARRPALEIPGQPLKPL